MPPADNTPNFDSMTPEEIMAWMESLAKRQGASEGFTTEANVEIAEIDPNSVVIDEPGYVPSEGKSKGKKIESITSFPKAAAPPAPAPEPIVAAAPVELPKPPPVVEQPAAALPPTPAPAAEPELASISWLESLAADPGGDFPQLDLSALSADLGAPQAAVEPATASPIDWLEGLAQSQGASTAEPTQPAAADSGDPMAWLESLAKRQGAKGDEFITDANLDVPLPESWASDGPGYTDYSVDMPGAVAKPAELNLPFELNTSAPAEEPAMEDPAAWLDNLASAQGFGNELKAAAAPQMSDDDIGQALARGEVVPHELMESWMSRQLEIGSQREEPEELAGDYDPDAPPVKAELPDWLLEQVGSSPPEETAPPAPAPSVPPLSDVILEPPAAADIPDWLREDSGDNELDNIFAPPAAAAQTAAPATAASTTEIDQSDPWVEAFDMEYTGKSKTDEVPDWYARNTGAAAIVPPAAVQPPAPAAPAAALQDAALEPERDIPVGQPDAMPDWLQGIVSEEPAAAAAPGDGLPDWLQTDFNAAPAGSSDIPDWLKAVDVEASDVPDWLTETISTSTTEQPVVTVTPTPQPAAPAAIVPAAPVYAAPPAAIVPARSSPAPIPLTVTQIDVAATLNAARAAINGNDIDGSLEQYDLLVRANAQLDAVSNDLTALTEKVKNSSALFRVLGDSLMRQGRLQAALDIYRKALNQL